MALTAGKAKKMLEDGTVHGRALTDKQKKYFGAIAGGATPMKKINGGWLDKYAMGGSLPGASGMMYARTNTPEPLYTQSEMKAKSGGRCWPGYKTVPGKTPFSKGSCTKAQRGVDQERNEAVIESTAVRQNKPPTELELKTPPPPRQQPMISQGELDPDKRRERREYAERVNEILGRGLTADEYPLAFLSNPLRAIGDFYNSVISPIGNYFSPYDNFQPIESNFFTSDALAEQARRIDADYYMGKTSQGEAMYEKLKLALPETAYATLNLGLGAAFAPAGSGVGGALNYGLNPVAGISSPLGYSTDAITAAKPNVRSTKLVDFTYAPEAKTVAKQIDKSNPAVARNIIQNELLEISTEGSRFREYQREAFKDLSSPEGFKRLVAMEEEYLRSIGYSTDKPGTFLPIRQQAEINAQARLREIRNAGTKNQRAGELAAQIDEMSDEQLMNAVSEFFYGPAGKRMYNNASYQAGRMLPVDDLPPWIQREYVEALRKKKFNIIKGEHPILGKEINIPEIMIGRSWVGNKPIYAHELLGHGFQKGRTMPQDNWIRRLIQPLEENSPMWTGNSKAAYDYFMKGSKGREPMAFVQELRQAMMDAGLLKTRYQQVTPELIKKAQIFFRTNPRGSFNVSTNKFLSNTRIFDFMAPTQSNFANVSNILNKLPAAVPPVIGAAMLGVDGDGTQAPPQMRNGGKAQNGEVLGFDNVLDYVVKTRGGDRDRWGAVADTIAFHESGPRQRMNPEARQYPKGPGRGVFQFEGPSLKTAQNRYKTVANVMGVGVNPNILNATSADQLSLEDQYTLFYVNMLEGPAQLGKYPKGEIDIIDLWLDGHKLIESPGNRESFLESQREAQEKGIEGGYKSFRTGGWLEKYEVIEDDMGQLTNPGKITKINSNNITMKGVDFPVLGISDTGDKKMMLPGKDYKFDGSSVTEYPMAQEGGGLNKEGVNQYQFLKSYMNSQMYQDRLKKEFPNYTDKQIAEEAKTRLNNVMQTRVGFLPESSDFSTSNQDVQGVYNRFGNKNIQFRAEYSALTPENPLFDYNTTPIHEFAHAADEGGDRIPQSTKDLMFRSTKDNALGIPKQEYYYTNPTEVLGRIQELRYLLNDQGIYDSRKDIFTQEDLDKARKNKRIKYNARFQDLEDSVESDEALIEMMNSIAAVNQDNKQQTMTAKQGRSLVTLDQLTNFTNYNTLQPGGWLDKYN